MATTDIEREYNAALQRIRRDDLQRRINGLPFALATVPPRPGALRERRIAAVLAAIKAFDDGLIENPFHSAPPERVSGLVTLGWQARDAQPVGVEPVELCANTAVFGSTGSGKTAFIEHVLGQLDVVAPTVQQCFFDPKNDWRARAARNKRTIIIHPDTRFNFLIPPSFLTAEEFQPRLWQAFADATWGAHTTRRLLKDAYQLAFTEHPSGPSTRQLLSALQRVRTTDREARANTVSRIEDVCVLFPGIANATPPCLTWDDLCDEPVYFPSSHQLATFEFLFTLWVNLRHDYHQHRGIRDELHTIVVADEGLQIAEATTRHIGGTPLLSHTIGKTRESGIAFALTLSSPRSTSPILLANLNIQTALRQADGAETQHLNRTFRLTPQQHEYLDHRLTRGQAIIRLGNRYPEPILITYPPPPNKELRAGEWEAAVARTNNRIPPPAIAIIETSHKPEPTRLALNKNEERVVSYLAEHGVALVSDISTGLELHPMALDRARKKLESVYKFVESGRVKTGRGRGKAGIALRLTALAYNWLGKRSHGMRGHSGIQHHYWCNTIARALGGNLETTIGDKSVDIALNYDPTRHDGFLQLVFDTAHRLTDELATVRAGDVIAIEVESDGARTASNNASKNHAAGMLTIIAVHDALLPTYAALKELDPEVWPHTVLVDILWFLDTVREAT